jgi:hypothetical protein
MQAKPKKPAAIIAQAFDAIPDIYDGFNTIRTRLFKLYLASEKQFRKDKKPVAGFTAADAARFFIVQGLANYTTGTFTLPCIASISSMPYERVLAASYAAEHRHLLRDWAESVPAECLALDYCELMKD